MLDLFNRLLRSRGASNLGFLFLEKIIRLFVGVFIAAWTARYLGVSKFGQWNYAIAICMFLQIIPFWGLPKIVVKKFVESNSQQKIIGSVFVLKLFLGVISLMISIIVGVYNPDTRLLIIIMSFAFVFHSLDVIDYYFQSIVLSKYVVISKLIGFCFSSFLKVIFIVRELDLEYFAVAYLADFVIIGLFLLYFNQRKGINFNTWIIKGSEIFFYLKAGLPLMLSSAASWIYMKVDIIMIKEILDFDSLGSYSAAVRVSEVFYLFPVLLGSTVLPYLVKINKNSDTDLDSVTLGILTFTNIFFVLFIFGILITKNLIVETLYGSEFYESADILVTHAWTLLFINFSIVSSNWLVVTENNKLILYTKLIGSVVNIILNMVLIPNFSAIGAAYSTILTYFIAEFIAYSFFKQSNKLFFIIMKSCLFPYKKSLSAIKNVILSGKI